MTTFIYRHTEPSLWTVGVYTPGGEWAPEADCASPDEAAARVNWLNGGREDGSCPNALTALVEVLAPEDDEQCNACEAVYNWDNRSSYCPYHQGVLTGYDRAMGEISEAAGAFQRDPELVDTVIERAEQMRARDYELAQQAANKPQPEGLSEHEHEVLHNSYADAEESPNSRWPEEVTVEIPGKCLYCGLQELRYHPTTANVRCAHCRAKQ